MASTRAGLFLLGGSRLLRESLARLLRKDSQFMIVGSGPYDESTLAQILAAKCELLVADSATAARSDIRFVREALAGLPELKVTLIGMEDDEAMFLEAVRAGAVGYVLKDASAMDVVAAVRAVAQGDAACPPRLCRALLQYVARQARAIPNIHVRLQLGLTRRQQQLVPLIAEGLTNKEIGCRLNLSEQTIKNHIHRMMQRVGAGDRLQVVEMVRVEGMLV